MGCRTWAWAQVQATAYSAWARMAARAGCRRTVCGAARQDVELLKVLEQVDGASGPVALHEVGPDPEGPDRTSAAL